MENIAARAQLASSTTALPIRTTQKDVTSAEEPPTTLYDELEKGFEGILKQDGPALASAEGSTTTSQEPLDSHMMPPPSSEVVDSNDVNHVVKTVRLQLCESSFKSHLTMFS